MIHFITKYYKLMYKVGEGPMDIKNLSKDSPISEYTLLRTLKEMELNEIVDFLNYQHSNSEYPITFFGLLFTKFQNSKFIKDKELRKVIFDWLKVNSDISNTDLRISYDIVYPSQFTNEFEKFKKELDSYLEFKPEDEIVKFTEFALNVLEEAISIHRLDCVSTTCNYELNYIQRNNYLKRKHRDNLNKQPIQSTKLAKSKASKNQIQWNGTQKQLAELFIELKKNGWIEEFKYPAIKSCFSSSATINQVLKPSTDAKTKEETYEQVYTTKYAPMFYGIKPKIKS